MTYERKDLFLLMVLEGYSRVECVFVRVCTHTCMIECMVGGHNNKNMI